MNQKSLRKEYINNFVKGFTLMELLVGSLIASVACLAIIYSATYYTQRLQSIKTKERAHEELKGYTDSWKARIAVNDITESGNTDSRQVCLTSKNNTCTQQALLTATIGDVTTSPIEGINDNEDSRVSRKALSTSIKWKTRNGADQSIEFYAEQLVMQP